MNTVPIAVAVYAAGENPIFSDNYVTHIKIEDEAAGPFLVISQPGSDEKEIRISDHKELDAIYEAAAKLLRDYELKTSTPKEQDE